MGRPVPPASDDAFAAITPVLQAYFDGLYTCDTALLEQVFHPQAIYATATGGDLVHHTMDTYLPIVAARESPASRNEGRRDAVLGIDLVGPVTALATVECAIGDRFFTDLLTLVRVEGRWQIIAKVFHYDIQPADTSADQNRSPTCPT